MALTIEANGLTPEMLADLEVPKNVRISPTGQQVIYHLTPASKKGKHAVSSVWTAEVGKEHSARQLTSGLFNDESPQWSPDGERVAFISDRAKEGESSAIYLLSLNGGEAYPVTKADNKKKISSFKWSPNGQFIAFVSADEKTPEREAKEKDRDDVKVYGEDWEYERLRCLHVATREISTLFAEKAHVKDFAWNENSSEITYVLHRTPDINSPGYHGVRFERLSLSTKQSTTICEFPGRIGDLTWMKDHLYFTARVVLKSLCSSTCVYKLSLSDAKWERDAYGEDSCASELRLTGQSVIVVKGQKGLSDHLHVLGRSDVYEGLHEIASWDVRADNSATGPVVVITKSSGTTPTEVYSIHNDKTTQLSQHSAKIASLHISSAQPLYCTAKDGTALDAVLLTPTTNSKPPKPLPTILLIHGGPYSRSTIAFDPFYYLWAPYLTSAGYCVLLPNYRGNSSRGDVFAAAARGGMGTLDYSDIISVLRAGIANGIVDEDRVAVGGWSQGGFLSYLAVTRPDFTFKAAVCGAGVSDWDAMSMTSDAHCFEAELAGKAPWAVDDGGKGTAARHGSPLWHMKDVRTPILILHGEEDARVPFTQAVAFHRGCLHRDIPCEMVSYPREGHIVTERAHFIDMLKRVRRFYDTHLL